MAAIDARNDENLQLLLSRIVPALEPEAVYLFGSRARGDFDEDSDYDLFVIVPDDAPKERCSVRHAYECKIGTGIPADIVPCRHENYEKSRNIIGTLSYEVAQSGVLIYNYPHLLD